jgi:ssDNA-binding Zn-finger/Zn-ribbon topoisomerase 1
MIMVHKIKRNYPKKDYVILTEENIKWISATPPTECWICDDILKHSIYMGKGKNAISKKYLKDEGFEEHLAQIVGEKKVFG